MSKKAMAKIVKISKTKLKEDFATHKVELSLMDDIDEALGQGFGMEEFIDEQLSIAQEAMTKARDIRRFDMTSAYTDAEQLINEAEAALKDLGLESNQEIKEYKKQLESLEKLIDDLEQRQDRIG